MELVIESIDGTGTEYEFTVDGEILEERSIERADVVGEDHASGTVWVQGARDEYTIRGGLSSLRVDGTARVLVDGTPVAGGVRRQTCTTNERDAGTVDIALYSTKSLLTNTGRVSERTVADYTAAALDRAGYDYDISYHHEALYPPDEIAHCSGDCLDWFARQELPREAADSNVLLADCDGGGCGYIGGNRCTAPGAQIIGRIPYTETGRGRVHGALHATLHEIAHNLGARHDHDAAEVGAQHWGMGYNEGGFWHRTPTVGGNDTHNVCGEYIERRRYSQAVFHQYFHDCAAERFRITSD